MNFPVVLCGGSNGTSYFSGLWSSGKLPTGAHPVRVVTRRPERFKEPLTVRESYQPGKGTILGDSVFAPISWREYKSGKVDAYDYSQLDLAFRDAECIWICAPVNAYDELLEKIMPAAIVEAERAGRNENNPLLICIMYAQGGVDWMAISKAGGRLPRGVGLCLLKNFPALISRTSEQVVENFGYHPNCAWYAPYPKTAAPAAKRVCKALFANNGHSWAVQELKTPLLCTLGGSNQLLHPTIIGGLLGQAPGISFKEQPKVYRGLPFRSFQLMASIWKETMALSEALETVFKVPIMDKVGFAGPVRNIMKLNAHHWPESILSMMIWVSINATSRLRAAKMPVIPNPHHGDKIAKLTDTDGPLVFNANHRFIVDDVPYGLCVLQGIGEIVEVPMPATGKLIADLQLYLKKEYVVVEGARFVLKGRDAKDTGAPQAYGVTTLAQLRQLIVEGQLPFFSNGESGEKQDSSSSSANSQDPTSLDVSSPVFSRL